MCYNSFMWGELIRLKMIKNANYLIQHSRLLYNINMCLYYTNEYVLDESWHNIILRLIHSHTNEINLEKKVIWSILTTLHGRLLNIVVYK